MNLLSRPSVSVGPIFSHSDALVLLSFPTRSFARQRVVIPETKTLRDVLTHPGYTIPGLPVFLVVPRGGMFEKIVLSGKWKVPM